MQDMMMMMMMMMVIVTMIVLLMSMSVFNFFAESLLQDIRVTSCNASFAALVILAPNAVSTPHMAFFTMLT